MTGGAPPLTTAEGTWGAGREGPSPKLAWPPQVRLCVHVGENRHGNGTRSRRTEMATTPLPTLSEWYFEVVDNDKGT